MGQLKRSVKKAARSAVLDISQVSKRGSVRSLESTVENDLLCQWAGIILSRIAVDIEPELLTAKSLS